MKTALSTDLIHHKSVLLMVKSVNMCDMRSRFNKGVCMFVEIIKTLSLIILCNWQLGGLLYVIVCRNRQLFCQILVQPNQN